MAVWRSLEPVESNRRLALIGCPDCVDSLSTLSSQWYSNYSASLLPEPSRLTKLHLLADDKQIRSLINHRHSSMKLRESNPISWGDEGVLRSVVPNVQIVISMLRWREHAFPFGSERHVHSIWREHFLACIRSDLTLFCQQIFLFHSLPDEIISYRAALIAPVYTVALVLWKNQSYQFDEANDK